ncbi:hypothetical protein ACJMK2_016642 [Sinanodonta woodiana]|uniref:RING-type domain-containing protein n=1 Tax=Sinanodonta woodiana TaxID=1069815 RepID=A0ABD3UV37_SINWO
MALASEHLTCPICLDIFRQPRALLPCLHNFCEACLKDYIVDKANRGLVNCGFECPFCRKFVAEPAPNKSPQEWAALYPLNHLIVSLVDSFRCEDNGGNSNNGQSQGSVLEQNGRQLRESDADSARLDGQSSVSDENNKSAPSRNLCYVNIDQDAHASPMCMSTKEATSHGLNNLNITHENDFPVMTAQYPDYINVEYGNGSSPLVSGILPQKDKDNYASPMESEYVTLRQDAILTDPFERHNAIYRDSLHSLEELPPPPPGCGPRHRPPEWHPFPHFNPRPHHPHQFGHMPPHHPPYHHRHHLPMFYASPHRHPPPHHPPHHRPHPHHPPPHHPRSFHLPLPHGPREHFHCSIRHSPP